MVSNTSYRIADGFVRFPNSRVFLVRIAPLEKDICSYLDTFSERNRRSTGLHLSGVLVGIVSLNM